MATSPCWNCRQPATHTLTREGSNTLHACDNCTRIDRAEAESRGWTVAKSAENTDEQRQMEADYQNYARWAVGPLMTREQWFTRQQRIKEQAAAGTLPTNPAEWGVDMDAVRASLNLDTSRPA